ncbi:FGGY-family carbohydrate kinase [Ruegeria sp. 2205SS24-7]|uniref:FGGY-family carbohydrate kinase n=1 Tax=Ruegeria discodermiae TaxID=3064389 RepID=UPI002740AA73|nr:FGGY-family carbohydrate kinase [Ruegeria sp. 2205SS24-7]MDP5220961.1 FGGY-family carbohydrate kinase [Ruegeria sp. 2205SS24-7]
MTPLALGIDIGTSGARAAALSEEGDLVAETAVRMQQFGPNRRDPAIWRQALAATLGALWQKVDAKAIGALAVDGTSGTVLGLDAADRPVGQALMYDDAVDAAAIPARIAQVAPRESAAHGAASGLARAIALQASPNVVRILHQADWVAELLSASRLPSDESNALKTGYDPVLRRWPDWIAATGLDTALLPDVVPAGQQTGESSGAFGLPKGVPIVAGVTDGCASFLATGANAPGDGVTALGTTLTIKLLSDVPVFAPEHGIYSHRIGTQWLAGGASNTGGGVLETYFQDTELATLSARIDPERPTGLDYYPLVAPGERFPTADPALRPRLDPRPKDDALFLQGMFEAMARIEARGFALLAELGAPRLQSIRTVGGGAQNAVWSDLRHRALEVPVAETRSTSAAAGVARLALQSVQG